MKRKTKIILTCMTASSAFLLVACDSGGGSDDSRTQIDRMAFAAINTALIPSSQKDNFNQGDPGTDSATFCATMTATIDSLRAAVGAVPGFPPQDGAVSSSALTGIVCPDVITVNLANTVAFPNGRRLEDDVIDPILGLVLDRGTVLSGGPGVSDGVTLDSTFTAEFPFLGTPNG